MVPCSHTRLRALLGFQSTDPTLLYLLVGEAAVWRIPGIRLSVVAFSRSVLGAKGGYYDRGEVDWRRKWRTRRMREPRWMQTQGWRSKSRGLSWYSCRA